MIAKLKKYTDLKLHYQSDGNINDILDNAELPCAFVYLSRTAQLQADGLGLRKRANMIVYFVDKAYFDFNAEYNDKIIERMEKKAAEFLRNLQADNAFYLVQNFGLQYLYNYFDVNVTGVGLSLLIEETKCFAK